MAVEKPLNFSVRITAGQDALKVSLKVTVSCTREEESSDLQTCYTLTDRNKRRGREMGNITFHCSKMRRELDLKNEDIFSEKSITYYMKLS